MNLSRPFPILLVCALTGQGAPAPGVNPASTLPWPPQAATRSAVVGPDFAVLAVDGDGRSLAGFRALLTVAESGGSCAFQAGGRRGAAQFRDVRAGKYHLWIVPEDPWLMPGPYCSVEVKQGGARTLQVHGARARVERRLRLLQRSGEPCNRVPVELLLVLQPGLPVEMAAVPFLRPVDPTNVPRVLLLSGGVTDQDGGYVLCGPQDAACVLRVRMENSGCEVMAPVRFDTLAPLTLQLGGDMALAGRLGPSRFLSDLREMMGVPREGTLSSAQLARMPTVRALRTDAQELDWAELVDGGRGAVPVAADGSFLLPDLSEPGRHVLLLETPSSIWRLGHFAPSRGELAARVTIDDVPAAGARLLYCWGDQPPRDAALRMRESFQVDGSGNIDVAVPAGNRVFTCLWRGPGEIDLELRTPVLQFVQGQVMSEPIALKTAPLRIQAVDSRGQPMAGVVLQLRDANGVHRELTAETDYRGRSEIARIEVQKFTLHALSRSRQIEAEGMAIAWVTGESFQVGEATPGAETTVIRIPWFWSR
jgi:hypothetical protein